MTAVATQHADEHADEHITITVFGRLVLLHTQIDAALDDETADRQYALEAVSAELARILDALGKAEADGEADGRGRGAGTVTEPTTYLVVAYPPPQVTGPPCPACQGAGVTGERYRMPTDAELALLVDVFCPVCGGCGSADPDHATCDLASHADPDFDGYADLDSKEAEAEAERCPSCHGRQWNPVQAFGLDHGEDPDGDIMLLLRVPCGCTEGRAQLLPVQDEEVAW